jgi:hypothetical protein
MKFRRVGYSLVKLCAGYGPVGGVRAGNTTLLCDFLNRLPQKKITIDDYIRFKPSSHVYTLPNICPRKVSCRLRDQQAYGLTASIYSFSGTDREKAYRPLTQASALGKFLIAFEIYTSTTTS